MNKWILGTLIVFGFGGLSFIMVAISGLGVYNTLIAKDEAANAQWANVENVYQRRLDLLPNLANTVERYAKHESGTLEAVIAARASASRPELKLTPDVLESPDLMAKFNKAQSEISSVFSRLMVVQEQYPNLKADGQFLNLQHEIAGTENRISVERRRYNETVQDVNTYTRSFFPSFINGFAKVKIRTPFKAEESANKAPVLFPVKG